MIECDYTLILHAFHCSNQTSIFRGSSSLAARHRFVAMISSEQPLNRNNHFVANPSVISHALTSHGSPHTTTFLSILEPLGPLKRIPKMSEHSSYSSKLELVAALIRLSRIADDGTVSIQGA